MGLEDTLQVVQANRTHCQAMTPSDTPETDAAEFPVMTWPSRDNPLVVRSTLARKLEMERDEARMSLMAMLARETLTCGWCGEMMHAPPGFRPPMTLEKLQATVRLHILDCPKHPIRETERELEEEKQLADRLGQWIETYRSLYGGQIADPECECEDCQTLLAIDELLAEWKQLRPS